MYLNGKKVKILGIPFKASMDEAVEIFAAIIRSAPYGKYTARAQFDIGRAREKQGANEAAIEAYQAVVEKFPNDPLAVDAQYQIGYIWFGRAQGRDLRSEPRRPRRKTGFQDFLYPLSRTAKKRRRREENLEDAGASTDQHRFEIAKFYDKQKHYRAAVIYYNEVIRQQPGSREGEQGEEKDLANCAPRWATTALAICRGDRGGGQQEKQESREPRSRTAAGPEARFATSRAAAAAGYRCVVAAARFTPAGHDDRALPSTRLDAAADARPQRPRKRRLRRSQ